MTRHHRTRGRGANWLLGCLGFLLVTATATAQGSRDHIAPSAWWPDIEEVQATVEKGRWKLASKRVTRLEEDVLRRSWHGPELKKVLTELAFLQAVTLANLNQDRRAVWYWHMAINLDFRVAKRDLSPYDRAPRLLLEFPLRRKGEIPIAFDPMPGYGADVQPAQMPRLNYTPAVLNNTGAALEHRGDLHLEAIIDQDGLPHQPVLVSSHLHPVILYAGMKYIFELPAFEPARIQGKPGDLKMDLRIQFEVNRW